MGELGALFNPGMRHELEERQAKAARREEEGNARDGDLRIDLESGVAVINVAGADDDKAATGDDAAAGGSGDEPPPGKAAGRHAAESSDDIEQAEAAPRPDPAPLRPRGKRGMSAAHR